MFCPDSSNTERVCRQFPIYALLKPPPSPPHSIFQCPLIAGNDVFTTCCLVSYCVSLPSNTDSTVTFCAAQSGQFMCRFHLFSKINISLICSGRSQWPRGLGCGSGDARLLGVAGSNTAGGYECLSVVDVVCCHVQVPESG